MSTCNFFFYSHHISFFLGFSEALYCMYVIFPLLEVSEDIFILKDLMNDWILRSKWPY